MNEVIYRANAINVIKKNHHRLEGCGLTEEILIEQIQALPSADRPTWIPCERDVPIKALEPVLVCNSKGRMTIACRTYDGKWGTQANIGEVVAWMPLPKPWKGADDEWRKL